MTLREKTNGKPSQPMTFLPPSRSVVGVDFNLDDSSRIAAFDILSRFLPVLLCIFAAILSSKELDFDEFTPEMLAFLDSYRLVEKSKKNAKAAAAAAKQAVTTPNKTEESEDEDDDHDDKECDEIAIDQKRARPDDETDSEGDEKEPDTKRARADSEES